MSHPISHPLAFRCLAAAAALACAGAAPPPERFIAALSADRISENLKILASVPRLAGTPADRRMADWVAGRLRDAGLTVETSEYQVWLPYPVSVSVEALGPVPYRCRLAEEGNLVDPDTTMPGVVMTYNAFSPSGAAEGELVYVNYGLQEDYETLEKLGVPVTGRVVIARYGRAYRGDKVALAAGKGASACLLYSDPIDDGYMKGDVLPRGPWRNEWGVQRGSVLRGAGDPLTPGWAATADARRLRPEEATWLPRIPVTPLSYGDAGRLLEQLAGPLAPHDGGGRNWQGGLPFAYHVGPGPTRVKVSVQAEYALRPIWDVVGTLQGSVLPDEAIVMGAHRDSWGPGATDNGSGSATLLEVAQVFGDLARAGSRPSRSLMFAFWDAEEFGIVGSTEWAEDHAAWLTRGAVAYLNVDVAATGARFNPSGSPSMWPLLLDAAGLVTDPNTRRTVREAWQSSSKDPVVSSLGGGSDFVPFSDALGIPATSHGFSGDGGGAYHSRLDTWWFVSRFMDPGFAYHVAAGAVWGAAALKLSEAIVIPYDQEATATEAIAAADEIESRSKSPAGGLPMPSLQPVREAARRYAAAAQRLASRRHRIEREIRETAETGWPAALSRYAAADPDLIAAERAFVLPGPQEGPDRRPRNLLLSPSSTDGYGAQRLPGIAGAFAAGDAVAARREIDLLAAAFDRAAERLEAAQRALRER